MRRFFAFTILFISLSTLAQNPVKWSTSVRELPNNQAELIITATIDPGWHLYSQFIPEGGPIPTSFSLEEDAKYSRIGKFTEGKPHEEFDKNFDMVLKYFDTKAVFKQKIDKKSTTDFIIKGELEFMVCDDTKCLPPSFIDISFKLNAVEPEASIAPTESIAPAQEQQNISPVKWSTSVRDLPNNQAELKITADIAKGWHLYSQFIPEGGPISTSFTLEENANYARVGEFSEGKAHEEYDKNFDMVLKYFDTKAEFIQIIDKKSTEDFEIKGELEFMVCDDEKCLPPTFVDISFDVKSSAAAATIEAEPEKESQNMWGIFIVGFLGGFAALLMPCIFPMIPLTVSFFTKQSKTKREGVIKATIYGVSIIVIYVALGMGVSLAFGPDTLNQMATDHRFNLVFFFLFVVFAISFFGAFEITLPSSWVNKADEASNKGGLIGIFFMAFTLSLVSFSCTGPIIGSLLVEAASKGSFYGPAIGMFGFALALSIPFTLFAAFPGWLNSLPKSGGWLNTVKVSLGFLELAFAFKFLSTADMVLQLHLLEREMFLAIWVGIAFLLAMYLLGIFKMPNDSPVDRISVTRMLFASVFFVFGFYMLPGIWGAPVKLISGFPPPEHYAESKGGAYARGSGETTNGGELVSPEVAASFGTHCPFDLNCFNDFESGLAYAKSVGKPILLDFTGWGCVNCRRMEENVWSNPQVLKRIRENVVLISLYVDERVKLPADKQYVSDVTGRKIKNVGNVWTEFQEVNFGALSQPYYLILGHDDLKPLIEPAAYDPNVAKYVDWLDRGVAAFKNK